MIADHRCYWYTLSISFSLYHNTNDSQACGIKGKTRHVHHSCTSRPIWPGQASWERWQRLGSPFFDAICKTLATLAPGERLDSVNKNRKAQNTYIYISRFEVVKVPIVAHARSPHFQFCPHYINTVRDGEGSNCCSCTVTPSHTITRVFVNKPQAHRMRVGSLKHRRV